MISRARRGRAAPRTLSLAGLAVAVGLAAAGCGGSSGPTARTGTGPAGANPPTSRTPARPGPARVSAAVAVWRLPAPVSRAVVVAQGSRLLVLGGLATGDVSTAAVRSLDPAAGSATTAGSLATAVHDAAGAVLGGHFFVFGGGAASTLSTVQEWPGSGTAHEVAGLPRPRSDPAATVLDGRAYVVGGFDGSAMDADILATADGTHFSVAGRLAVPVRYPATAAAAGAVWIVGGQLGTAESSAVGGQTDAVQRFDPATGRTTVVGRLPRPLGHASALVLGGRLLILGGRTAGTPSAAILEIDPRSGAAHQVGTLPGPRSDAGAAVAGGIGWLVGGEVTGPASPLDTVVEVSLVP